MSILLQKLSHKKYLVFLICAFIITGSVVIGLYVSDTNVSASHTPSPSTFLLRHGCYQVSSVCGNSNHGWGSTPNSSGQCVRTCQRLVQCHPTISPPARPSTQDSDPLELSTHENATLCEEKCAKPRNWEHYPERRTDLNSCSASTHRCTGISGTQVRCEPRATTCTRSCGDASTTPRGTAVSCSTTPSGCTDTNRVCSGTNPCGTGTQNVCTPIWNDPVCPVSSTDCGQPVPNQPKTCGTEVGCTGGTECPSPPNNTRTKTCRGTGTFCEIIGEVCRASSGGNKTCQCPSDKVSCLDGTCREICPIPPTDPKEVIQTDTCTKICGDASTTCTGTAVSCSKSSSECTDRNDVCGGTNPCGTGTKNCTTCTRSCGDASTTCTGTAVSCSKSSSECTDRNDVCGGTNPCGTGTKICQTTPPPSNRPARRDVYIKARTPTVVPVANSRTKLKVSWTKHAYFDGYQVYYCKGTTTECPQASDKNLTPFNNNWKQKRNTVAGNSNGAYTTTSVELTGLDANTQYWVMLLAYNLSATGARMEGRSKTYLGDYSTRTSATTNKQCPPIAYCGVGATTGGIVSASATCTSCPPNPTIQNPTYAVQKETCNVNATFRYSGGNTYQTSITELKEVAQTGGNAGVSSIITIKDFGQKTYTPSDKGVSFYTLKNNDYNKTLTFDVRSRRSTDPSGLWGRTTRQITTPTQPHPTSNFTIQQTDNNQIQLQYTPENRITSAGLRFRWTFSETPRFHNRTNQNSQNPRISFSTPGPKTITLRVTDTNISTTNGHCSSTQTLNAGNEATTQTQMQAPTINNVTYKLSDGPICTPQARITYTSPESTRTDILNLFIGDTQVHTDRVNVSTPDTRSFIVPINANTIYKAILTTHDFQKTPTKDPSNPAEYIFTTPNTTIYPTANFTHIVNSDGTLSLNYTGTDTIQWNFKEPVSYIQGSSTSNFVQVQFSTFGQKQVSLTAKSSAPELNSCQYTQIIDVRGTFTPSFPIIREVPPVRNR